MSFFLSFFLSLSYSFSGWSLGAQGPSVFAYLPGLLRPEQEGALHLHSLGRPGGHLRPTWKVQVPCLGALLAFCVNKGISASILFLSLFPYHQHRPHFNYPGSNWGWTPVPMFTAALVTTTRTWKQSRSPSGDEWIRKLLYICTLEYCSAIKRNTWVTSNEMDDPRAYYTEWDKLEIKRQISHISA